MVMALPTAAAAADWPSGTPCEFLHDDKWWYRAASCVGDRLELAEVRGAAGLVTIIGMEDVAECVAAKKAHLDGQSKTSAGDRRASAAAPKAR